MAGCSGLRYGFGVDRCDDSHLQIFIDDGDSVTKESQEEKNSVMDEVLRWGKPVTVGVDLQIQGQGTENNSDGENGKIVAPGPLEGENVSKGRNHNDMEGMLCWMNEIAMNPTGWYDATRRELMSTDLMVREARLKKRYTSHQKKRQRIGPSSYDDDPPAHHVEPTRISSRIPNTTKTLKCSFCSTSSTKQKRVANHSKGKRHLKVDLRKHKPYQVNAGPESQAEIPSRTGQVSEEFESIGGQHNHATDQDTEPNLEVCRTNKQSWDLE